jgi:hypothetical protein
MATITGRVTRMPGNAISTDELSLTYKGVKYVPYRISVTQSATILRGILMVAKGEIDMHGDPDGEAIALTIT